MLGIILEDGAKALYRMGSARTSSKHPPSWARLVGYSWVALFLTWSTPAFTYTMSAAYSGETKDEILPFSPLSALNDFVNRTKL